MKAIIWTSEDCPECIKAKGILKNKKVAYREIDVKRLLSGELPNCDALVALADQSMSVPVVSINGEFVKPEAIESYLEKRGES